MKQTTWAGTPHPTSREAREDHAPGPDQASERLAEWLERVARGDRDAFRALYDETSAYLLGVAFGLLRHRERSEEVLQECYLSVWHNAARFDRLVARPMTWLINIVRNRAIDAMRAQRSRQHIAVPVVDDEVRDLVVDLAPRPEQQLQRAMERRGMDAALRLLSSRERQALAMVIYRGLTHAEIAAHARVPLSTAKTWVRRGLAHLKAHLDASVPTPLP